MGLTSGLVHLTVETVRGSGDDCLLADLVILHGKHEVVLILVCCCLTPVHVQLGESLQSG